MRLVFDTNVIVSAALFADSVPGRAFRHALRVGEIVLSFAVLAELGEVLSRPKFARYIASEDSQEFLAALVNRATFVDITEQIAVCRDPRDNMFLELAVNGNAAIIVSGDSDLLVLSPFRDILIMTPTEFLTQ
jgi:uncharacterized protein